MGSEAVRCLCTELEGPLCRESFPSLPAVEQLSCQKGQTVEHVTGRSSSRPVDLTFHCNSNHVSLGPLGKRQVFTQLCNPRHYHRVPRTPAPVHSSPESSGGSSTLDRLQLALWGALCIGGKRGSLSPPG